MVTIVEFNFKLGSLNDLSNSSSSASNSSSEWIESDITNSNGSVLLKSVDSSGALANRLQS